MPYLQLKKEWLWLWLAPAVILLASSVIETRWHSVYELGGQFFLALALSSLVIPAKTLRFALITLMVAFLMAALSGPILASRIWQDPQALSLTNVLVNLRQNTVSTLAARSWNLPAGVNGLELSFEARLKKGELGWDWFRSAGGFTLTPLEENGTSFTRVVTPRGGDPYLMRTFELEGPAGGRTFRIQLDMRAPYPIPAEACRGVWLQTWGPGGDAECRAVGLGPEWRPVELQWTAPEASESSIIRVVLNDFDGLSFDVRDVKLYELEGRSWRRLEPLAQEAAALAVSWGGASEPHAGRGFVPTSGWQTFAFSLEPPQGASSLRALLSVGSTQSENVQVEVRNTNLGASGSYQPTPVPTYPRAQLWFSHPNLAAHTLLALTMAALTTTASLNLTLVVSSLAGLTIVLIRSRAAWLSLLLGVSWFSFLTPPLRIQRRRLTVLLAGIVFIGIGYFSANSFSNGVFSNRTGTSRPEIWQVAWHAFAEHPWKGIGSANFSNYWQETYKGSSQEIVPHAHNLWLQFASSYGLPGLIAVLWLTGGFLYLAWKWGRWHGLALVVPIFIMNIFDYTLFYSGVLFPLILGMNALRQHGSPARAEP